MTTAPRSLIAFSVPPAGSAATAPTARKVRQAATSARSGTQKAWCMSCDPPLVDCAAGATRIENFRATPQAAEPIIRQANGTRLRANRVLLLQQQHGAALY